MSSEILESVTAHEDLQILQSGAADLQIPLLDGSQQATAESLDAATMKDLENQGFPKIEVTIFKRAADQMSSIIMSRAPGKATTALIDHGHDLKGYQIKAKSCNWGPMSGFLCQWPCLNKVGVKKIEYNDEKFVKYFKYIKSKQDDDLDFKASVTDGFTPFIPLQIFDTKKKLILENADGSILHQHLMENGDVYGIAAHKKDPDDDSSATVMIEFLLQKTDVTTATGEALWSVYHGRIQAFLKSGETSVWADFWDQPVSYMDGEPGLESISDARKDGGGRMVRDLIANMPKGLVPPSRYSSLTPPDEVIDKLAEKLIEKKALDYAPDTHPGFYPICVAQNPFPPYDPRPRLKKPDDTEETAEESAHDYAKYLKEAKKHLYKNAVTGDYDLFAVWPQRKGFGWEDMVRASDIQQKVEDIFQKKKSNLTRERFTEPVFSRITTKPFGLRLVGSPNITIDVIPGFDEIQAWEDPEVGNINPLVFEAVNAINAFALNHHLQIANEQRSEAEKHGDSPNVRHFTHPNKAFHSDEAGRPGIDEIDLPVGVFLPTEIAERPEVQRLLNPNYKKGQKLIRQFVLEKPDYDKLLALTIAVRDVCLISYNHVWVTYLMGLVHKTPDEKGFFEPMADERKELGLSKLATIRSLLSQLFIGGILRVARPANCTGPWGMDPVQTWPKEAAAANTAMDKLAQAFVDAEIKTKAKNKLRILMDSKIAVPSRKTPASTAIINSDAANPRRQTGATGE